MPPLKRLISFLFLATSANAQSFSTDKALAEKIVQTIQQNQFDNIDTLLLTEKDYLNEYQPLMKADTVHKIPPIIFEEGVNFYKQNKNAILYTKVLSDIWKKGHSLGIADWKDVKFEELEMQKPPAENAASVLFMEIGRITINYFDKRFALFGVIMVKLSYGYKLLMIQGIEQI